VTRLGLSVAALLAVSFVSSFAALAQPVPGAEVPARDDPASRAEASRRFDEGVRLLRDRDWAGALASFEASRAIRPTPSVLFNIAGCQRALRRFAEARRTYQRFLVIGTRPDQRDEATRAIDELAAEVATMTIASNVEGAELLLDGRPVAAQPVDLDVGSEHAVEARREGYRSAHETVRPAAAGPFTVRLALEPVAPAAELRVSVPSPDPIPPAPVGDPAPPPPPPRSEGGSALPWILAGTAVVLAGAAVGGFFLFSGDEVPDADASFHPR